MSQIRTNSLVPAGGIPAGASGGGIIQIVSTTKVDAASTTSSTYSDITGLSLNITPRSTSNKVLVIFHTNHGHTGSSSTTAFRILRGGVDIAKGTYAGYGTGATSGGRISQADGGNASQWSMTHLDSPATTSATTYKIQWATQGSTAYLNRAGDSSASGLDRVTSVSSITLMEVSG